jgi:alpha-1,2-mannosyltransferase
VLRTVRNHPLALIVLVALVLRAYPWFLPHTLLGVMEVDDGVYYGASRMLLAGHLPYADFTIVHPPLTSILLLPFAAIGAVVGDPYGLAAARLAMAGVAVANVLLVHRLAVLVAPSRAWALAAAAGYAVMPDAVLAEHTLLLEPVVNLFCLSAVLLLLRGRPFVAGALFAVAGGVKVFAAAYVLAVIAWLILSHRQQLLRPLIAGLTTAGLVLIGPFFIANPSAFWLDVVTTQGSRPNDNTNGGLVRMLDDVVPHVVSLLVLLALIGAVLLAARAYERRHPGSWSTLWIVVTGAVAIAFANSPSYFPHYGAFLIPPLVILLAHPRVPRLTLAALVLIWAGASVHDVVTTHGQGDLAAAGRLVPDDACVWSEGLSLAIAADVLRLPDAKCPGWIDGRGVNLTWNTNWPHHKDYYPSAGFLQSERWQRETREQLQHAHYLLLSSTPDRIDEWTLQTQAYVSERFRPIWMQTSGRVRAVLLERIS